MSSELNTPEDILRTIKDKKVQMIELRFTDLSGAWLRSCIPPIAFGIESFRTGIELNGSAGRRDMRASVLAVPDPASAFLDPFTAAPILVLICNLRSRVTGQSNPRDPRGIAQSAEAYMRATDVGDVANFGVRIEHGVVECRQLGRDRTDGHAFRYGLGSSPNQHPWEDQVRVPPQHALQDFRTKLVATLQQIGIEADDHQREGPDDGRIALDFSFAPLARMADIVTIYKHVAHGVAAARGLATWLPRLPGNKRQPGTRIYQSIWLGERPLFAGDGYAGSSALMRHYIAGLWEHQQTLLAMCGSAGNAHRLPAPAFKGPVDGDCSSSFRPVTTGVSLSSPNPKAKRVEFLSPELPTNPYLAFAAMLMAGLDGFHSRLYSIDPDEPIANVQRMAVDGEASLSSGARHAFLSEGNVFPPDVVEFMLGKAAREVNGFYASDRALDGLTTQPAVRCS